MVNRNYTKTYGGAEARLSRFASQGMGETHIMLRVTDGSLSFDNQLKAIGDAVNKVCANECSDERPVFARLFLSDVANQGEKARRTFAALPCALSIIEQPPLDGTKVAVWLWLMGGAEADGDANAMHIVRRGGHRHVFMASQTAGGKDSDSRQQAEALLDGYAQGLDSQGLSLEANCVRTWFFVHDIDTNYAGMVKGRNELFDRHGLTADTHFIASTGIGGTNAGRGKVVMMDAYAVSDLLPGQLHYLYAPTHLNPTAEYGVAFERGAYIDYPTHRHIMISGTASINNHGEIMHEGDINRQMQRMCENVEALLAEAGAGWDDLQHIILYLRDIADYNAAQAYFNQRFAHIPRLIVNARVCRPGWLVEMECMGCVRIKN